MTRRATKLVREGQYSAEVPVDLIEDETAWSPYLSVDDARKLDAVRVALRHGDIAEASKYGRVFEASASNKDQPAIPPWLTATVEDVETVDFELPIRDSAAAESQELSEKFQAAIAATQTGTDAPDTAASRVFGMLSAISGIHFTPEHRTDPFAPMVVLPDGRRSPIPEDFRGAPSDVLAFMASRTSNPVLRARLSDISWLLDRKRAGMGTLALSSYIEIIRTVDRGVFRFRFQTERDVLTHDIRDLLRRALQIGRSVGWDKRETLEARSLAIELRKRANDRRAPVPVHWFSELDLDFGVSDPAEVGQDIEMVLEALSAETDLGTVADLFRLGARAYHLALDNERAYRLQARAADQLITQAESAEHDSALLASHHLMTAIAELHGLPGMKERRTALRHRLIDIQARIPEEMSPFSHEMDVGNLIEAVEKEIGSLPLLDKLLAFAVLAHSPEPEGLIEAASKAIREHPLASIFGASHLDYEGKVIHRTEGGLFADDNNSPAIQQQIAQSESVRRGIVAVEIDVARRVIVDQHYLSDDLFRALLQYCAFVPQNLLATFARGFSRFFRGDFVSALYILTPLLENSLRHILKAHGHDVTILNDSTQTQQDRTISSLFEQMRSELDAIFGRAITSDIEHVFLSRPGPYLRHSLAHGLLHDSTPYGPDAIYAIWLIMRLCLLPLFHYKDRIKLSPSFT